MAELSAGLLCASALAMYTGLGFSLARPEEKALAGLPQATRQQAERLYSDLRRKPWDSESEIRLGMFYLANGRPAPAADWLRRALVWNPQSWQAWYYLGCAQRYLKHYSAAQTALQKVLSLNPDYVAARVQMAWVLLDGGLYDDAVEAFTGLLRSSADQIRIGQAIGTAQLRSGKLQLAEQTFSQLALRAPSYGAAHAGLATVLKARGEAQRADREARLARNLLGLVPPVADDPLTETMEEEFPTALSLFQRGARERDPQNAIDLVQKALALDPRLPNGWEVLIALYGQAHKAVEAEKAWAQLDRIDPRNVRGRYVLAVALAQAGERPQAETYLKQALELDPGDADAYRMTGLVLQLDGKREEAAEYYRRATETDPAMAQAYIDLGLLRLRMGQTREAQAALLKALLPPCEQPDRTLMREIAALQNDPAFESSFEQAVRSQAVERNQPVLLTVLNNRKKPEANPQPLP
jgi:tetratricopeptide (TPR) repeat protein